MRSFTPGVTRWDIYLPAQLQHSTYWISHSDYSNQLHYIAMMELAINGCFLKKLDLVTFSGILLEQFDGHLPYAHRGTPQATLYMSEVTRSKSLHYPIREMDC